MGVFEQVCTPLSLASRQDFMKHKLTQQILEMDDDPEDREFSREIVVGFFEQAEDNLNKMSETL